MYAALFETESWLGTRQYIFEGGSASELLSKFENIQNLQCLVHMGLAEETSPAAIKSISKLSKLLDSHYDGTLTVEELKTLDLKISIGAVKCVTVIEGDDAADQLKKAYPNAK